MLGCHNGTRASSRPRRRCWSSGGKRVTAIRDRAQTCWLIGALPGRDAVGHSRGDSGRARRGAREHRAVPSPGTIPSWSGRAASRSRRGTVRGGMGSSARGPRFSSGDRPFAIEEARPAGNRRPCNAKR